MIWNLFVIWIARVIRSPLLLLLLLLNCFVMGSFYGYLATCGTYEHCFLYSVIVIASIYHKWKKWKIWTMNQEEDFYEEIMGIIGCYEHSFFISMPCNFWVIVALGTCYALATIYKSCCYQVRFLYFTQHCNHWWYAIHVAVLRTLLLYWWSEWRRSIEAHHRAYCYKLTVVMLILCFLLDVLITLRVVLFE